MSEKSYRAIVGRMLNIAVLLSSICQSVTQNKQ